ncbi:hypothetical protein E0Z10_g2383 [Xylaria hypoxylon]|uniref:U1-type domain-containing protein n=1 Tax=Xylaria hypoxylon TaxID=37992 RepID=A0A4Z0YQW0_9PEZI|nr:hypothetical protein E0Z10_g2383 [Xylaria hypoxylon]
MADARALLRAHRVENRIKHPHAVYSDAGKLLCKLCHEAVKTESFWDTHVRSQSHRQRLQALQQQPSPPTQDESAQKRKRSDDADETMSDAGEDQDAIRAKRSKTDATSTSSGPGNGVESNTEKEKTQTPPGLARRTSGTPVQGVEIAIPSRPATPLAGSTSAVSTPKAMSMGRSPLVGSDTSSMSGVSVTAVTSMPISTDVLTVPSQNGKKTPSTSSNTTAQASSTAIDEAEWAAFEAEMSVLDVPAPPAATNTANGRSNHYEDAVISAPALSAAQLAAKSQEEEHERRKTAMEAEMADEREDATRALETEFEEMEELESRVRRLKERREELRKESVMNLRGAAAVKATAGAVNGKENVRADNLEEDDDEDEDDEWDGFRFRV